MTNRILPAVMVVLLVLLLMITFGLGRRWESNEIRLQLKENGIAESRYGDNDWIKIAGTVEEYEQ